MHGCRICSALLMIVFEGIQVTTVFERELALLVALQGESIWKGDKVEGTVSE